MPGLIYPNGTLFHRVTLHPLQRRFILREVCGLNTDPPASEECTPEAALLTWWSIFLFNYAALTADQQRLLLKETAPAIGEYAAELHDALVNSYDQKIIDFSVALTDCGHATWTQRQDLLNLETGDYVRALPRRALITTAISISEIARRGIERCERVKQGQDQTAARRRGDESDERGGD